MPLSERLRYARARTGLTGSQVRDRTSIGESSLSEFENGKREPSLAQLQKLASAYRRPLAFFLSDEPIPEEAAVLWREEPADSKEIEARFLLFYVRSPEGMGRVDDVRMEDGKIIVEDHASGTTLTLTASLPL